MLEPRSFRESRWTGVQETLDGVRVTTKDGRVFEARYAIGADGANSVVARSLGLRRGKTTAAAIEVEVPVAPDVLRRFGDAFCFIFGDVPFGYLWIFPKAEHLSVGIGALHPQPGRLQATLKRVMARYGISLDGVAMHGHPIPIYSRKETLATRRVVLVGDAAGLADPVTGEGIRLAIKSGRLAADAILADRLDQYDRMVFRHIGLCHALGMALSWLFYASPRTWFRLGAANPSSARRSSTCWPIAQAMNRSPWRSLARRSLARCRGTWRSKGFCS